MSIKDLLTQPVARAALLGGMGSFLRAVRDDEPHIVEGRALNFDIPNLIADAADRLLETKWLNSRAVT